MSDEAQVIFLGGATGTSKSLLAGHVFFDWLNELPVHRTQCFIFFKDRGTGVRNFLEDPGSAYNLYPFLRSEFRDSKTGGLQFQFYGQHGIKNVYIMGADNKTAWQKALGGNTHAIWMEELSVLDIDAIRECFARTISRNCRLIATTNGGLPTQEFYTEFLNHAMVKFPDKVPAIEMADMKQDKSYYSYYHFNLNDDTPWKSDEDRQKLWELFPPGSFYYNSKILGCRGFVEGAAYATLMDRKIHLQSADNINIHKLKELVLSVDIGSNRTPEDKSKSTTVATLVGFSKEYQRAVILECWAISAISHDEIIKQVEKHIEPYWVKYMRQFSKIVIDSAEAILINTWRNKNKFNTLTIKGAVKSSKVINLVSRVTLKQQLITQRRLLWSDGARNSYDAHTHILSDDKGGEMDNNDQDNDMADSLTYALTENWANLTKEVARHG